MKVNLLLIPWLLLSLFSFRLWVEEVLPHQQVILLCLVQDHHMVHHLWPTRTWVVGKHVRFLDYMDNIWILFIYYSNYVWILFGLWGYYVDCSVNRNTNLPC